MPGLYTEADYENSVIELTRTLSVSFRELCQIRKLHLF